jgi:hypothetical protein
MVIAISTRQHEHHEVTTGIPALTHPLPDLTPDLPVELVFSEFGYTLSAPFVERSSTIDSRRTTIKAAADEDVLVVCRLKGAPIEGSSKLRSEELSLDFDLKSPRPRAKFVAASLRALLGLSKTVRLRIPSLALNVPLEFSVPLEQVGKFCYDRWVSYQLMVIERAFGLEIDEPPGLLRKEQEQIAFVYRAIVERGATSLFYQGEFALRADERTRALLESGDSFQYQFTVDGYEHSLPGLRLILGSVVVTLSKAAFANPDQVRRELERLDGHDFIAVIRTLDGLMKYEFPDVPHFSMAVWDERIARLIALEDALSERHFEAVDKLAAGSLAGMTQEQIEAVTQPLTFDDEAFADPEI